MLTVMLACLVAGLTQEAGQGVEPHVELLKHLKNTYISNKQIFDHIVIKFEYVDGSASDAAEARLGRLQKTVTARGLYAYDGMSARYDCLFPLDDMSARQTKAAEGRWISSIISQRLLTDGKSTLSDRVSPGERPGEEMHAAQIFPGTKMFYNGDLLVPINLGFPEQYVDDFHVNIDNIINNKYDLNTIDLNAKFDGRDVIYLAFRAKYGKREYWIDAERGAIPLQMRDTIDGRDSVFLRNQDDIHQEPNSGWLPRKVTHHLVQLRKARQLVIREIDVGKPPTRSIFALDFPEPVGMVDTARNLTYSPRKTWSLLRLPSANAPETRRLQQTEYRAPPTMPGELPSRWSAWAIALAVFGVVLLLTALARIIRNSRRGR